MDSAPDSPRRPRLRTLELAPALALISTLAWAPACGDRTLGGEGDDEAGTGDGDGSSDTGDGDGSGDTGDGGGSSDTGDAGTEATGSEDTSWATTGASTEDYSCECADLSAICSEDPADLGMPGCDLPSPCGVVDGTAEPAQCVLQLLASGEPGRFAYDVFSTLGCPGDETWRGWFYVLGPGVGIDNECYIDDCSNLPADPPTFTPSATHFTLEDPSYFADCIGESASVMTGCIFNGLTAGGSVAECGP